MLILGRVLLGTGVGFTNQVHITYTNKLKSVLTIYVSLIVNYMYIYIFVQSVPLYLSEMAPPENRGAFNIGFEVCLGLGILSANLTNQVRLGMENLLINGGCARINSHCRNTFLFTRNTKTMDY